LTGFEENTSLFNPHESSWPQVSPAGSGVQGHLHIECQVDSHGRTFLRKQSFRAPIHLSKPHWDGNYLIINVVNPTAGLFAGDHVEVTVRVCAGARAVLTTPSATRVFRAKHSMQRTEIVQIIVVENGGRLDVCPDILIAHGGARYSQASRIEVHAGGELFFTEMLAPGRTASGETFAYEQLEFSTDLIVGSRLVVREKYCLDASSQGLESLRRRFPNAYYASSLVVSRAARAELLQREIAGLNGASLLAGGSRPADDVYIIKLVATDSMSLRKAMSKVRTLVYSHWESPEPMLRKL
jgi:urease accessory protein